MPLRVIRALMNVSRIPRHLSRTCILPAEETEREREREKGSLFIIFRKYGSVSRRTSSEQVFLLPRRRDASSRRDAFGGIKRSIESACVTARERETTTRKGERERERERERGERGRKRSARWFTNAMRDRDLHTAVKCQSNIRPAGMRAPDDAREASRSGDDIYDDEEDACTARNSTSGEPGPRAKGCRGRGEGLGRTAGRLRSSGS